MGRGCGANPALDIVLRYHSKLRGVALVLTPLAPQILNDYPC